MAAPLTLCLAEANEQIRQYKLDRQAEPSAFGNSSDGAWDGTPEHGPMLLPIVWLDAAHQGHWRVLWGVHKHPWPLTYIYCFGTASQSRGERTDPAFLFDIRNMPKRFIGRFNLDRDPGCGRKSHRKIITRALADGFDLSAIAEAPADPVGIHA